VPETSSAPTSASAAVQRCCAAYNHTLAAELPNGRFAATTRASEAYRKAMPFLSNYSNIRDFIACVTHGMLIEAIPDDRGARFLYAAQVALGAFYREPKPLVRLNPAAQDTLPEEQHTLPLPRKSETEAKTST